MQAVQTRMLYLRHQDHVVDVRAQFVVAEVVDVYVSANRAEGLLVDLTMNRAQLAVAHHTPVAGVGIASPDKTTRHRIGLALGEDQIERSARILCPLIHWAYAFPTAGDIFPLMACCCCFSFVALRR